MNTHFLSNHKTTKEAATWNETINCWFFFFLTLPIALTSISSDHHQSTHFHFFFFAFLDLATIVWSTVICGKNTLSLLNSIFTTVSTYQVSPLFIRDYIQWIPQENKVIAKYFNNKPYFLERDWSQPPDR